MSITLKTYKGHVIEMSPKLETGPTLPLLPPNLKSLRPVNFSTFFKQFKKSLPLSIHTIYRYSMNSKNTYTYERRRRLPRSPPSPPMPPVPPRPRVSTSISSRYPPREELDEIEDSSSEEAYEAIVSSRPLKRTKLQLQ